MSVVTELGYLGLDVSDLEAWKAYAGEIAGMQVVDEGDPERIFLRMDKWHHRLTLHKGSQDDLAYLGWRVAGISEFEKLQEKLTLANIQFDLGTAEEARERHVLGLIKLLDPSGIPTEIFYGPHVERWNPFHPGRPMFGRFVTEAEGIGHCILRQDDTAAAVRFYELLGFRGGIEYKLTLPDGSIADIYFMSANKRQHSIAFGSMEMSKRINHLMLEYTDLDDLGRTHDLIRQRKVAVAKQLGKHSNDEAFTFYCANPSGWLWEFGWKGKEAPEQMEYYTRDIFGHGVEMTGLGVDTDVGGNV